MLRTERAEFARTCKILRLEEIIAGIEVILLGATSTARQ